jgi:Amt family ammonium transporter
LTLPTLPLAWATPAAAAEYDSGSTAWVLVSSALVLFMMISGLALFYGGLVRTKNVLSVLMQCIALTAVITVLWFAFGYSLAFDATGMEPGGVNLHSFVGSLRKAFLAGATWALLRLVSAWLGGLRVDIESETRGLDLSLHDESGYNT